MRNKLTVLAAATGFLFSVHAGATGAVTCDSGPKEDWQSTKKLFLKLIEEGWDVRKVKKDGGCYEVYAMDAEGERIEAYFDPVTLEPVPVEEDTPEEEPIEEAAPEPAPAEQQD